MVKMNFSNWNGWGAGVNTNPYQTVQQSAWSGYMWSMGKLVPIPDGFYFLDGTLVRRRPLSAEEQVKEVFGRPKPNLQNAVNKWAINRNEIGREEKKPSRDIERERLHMLRILQSHKKTLL